MTSASMPMPVLRWSGVILLYWREGAQPDKVEWKSEVGSVSSSLPQCNGGIE